MAYPKKWAWLDADKVIIAAFFRKLDSVKGNRRYAALLMVEFFLSMVLVASIAIWLDYRFNVIEFPFNILFFSAVLYGIFHFYRYTESFRNANTTRRQKSFRTFFMEFLIFAVVVSAGYIYQDPKINTLQYPFNFILFMLVLLPLAYFYVNEKFLKV